MYGSLSKFLTKKRKKVITPKKEGDPEKRIPDGFKQDPHTKEIVPLGQLAASTTSSATPMRCRAFIRRRLAAWRGP